MTLTLTLTLSLTLSGILPLPLPLTLTRCARRPPAGLQMQRGLALLRAIHSRAWGHAERLAAEAVEAEAEAAKAEKGQQAEEAEEVKQVKQVKQAEEVKEAEAVKEVGEVKAGGMGAEEGGEATDKAPSPRALSCPEPAATPEEPAAGWAAVVSYVQQARRQS